MNPELHVFDETAPEEDEEEAGTLWPEELVEVVLLDGVVGFPVEVEVDATLPEVEVLDPEVEEEEEEAVFEPEVEVLDPEVAVFDPVVEVEEAGIDPEVEDFEPEVDEAEGAGIGTGEIPDPEL